MSNYTAHRTGDYIGDPRKRARGWMSFLSDTMILVEWTPIGDVDPHGTDHLLLQIDGVAHADRSNRQAQTITVVAGHVPHVCAIYIPVQVDYDGLYDPTGGDPLAENCYLRVPIFGAVILLAIGNVGQLSGVNASQLREGNRSLLRAGMGVN